MLTFVGCSLRLTSSRTTARKRMADPMTKEPTVTPFGSGGVQGKLHEVGRIEGKNGATAMRKTPAMTRARIVALSADDTIDIATLVLNKPSRLFS